MLAYAFVLALLAPTLVSAQTQGIRQCTGGRPFPQRVYIEGCPQAPCNIFQGSDAIMEVDFRTLSSANSLRPQVFATALGATVEYTLPPTHREGCNHLRIGSCPLSHNEDATYRFVFSITSIYPPIPVAVELSLFDHISQIQFCAVMDVHVRIR